MSGKASSTHRLNHARVVYISTERFTAALNLKRESSKELVPPVAIRRNPDFEVFNVRLLIALDKMLRAQRRYQGDLSASINDALLAVNLNTVKLVTLQGKKKQIAKETQVVLLRRLIRRIRRIADARACSINQLINSGLMAYYSKKKTAKLKVASTRARGSTMGTYDEMSAAERKQLIQAIASLTGLREGPKEALPDGSRYEYDPDLKRTLEVTAEGKRFPVVLVAGKFQREPEKT